MKTEEQKSQTGGAFAGNGRKDMNKAIVKRLGNLLGVKSLVTLTLTGVFTYMAVTGTISQDFMTVYAVVIAFYFGTQSQEGKREDEGK